MNKLLLLIACAPLALTPLISADVFEGDPEQKIVKKIEIIFPDGNKKKVSQQLFTKEGGYFDQDLFDKDLRKLSEDYKDINPAFRMEEGQLVITLSLSSQPIIRSIRFSNNPSIKAKTLRKDLSVKRGSMLTEKNLALSIKEIKRYYAKEGFYETQVSTEVLPYYNRPGEGIVKFTIKEGRKGHIKRVSFKGFTKEERAAIKAQMLSSRYSIFTSWLSGEGKYNKEYIHRDQMTITNYIQNLGYPNASVSIQTKKNEDHVALEIVLERGEKYSFGNITFENNSLFSSSNLLKRLRLKSGDPLSEERLQLAVTRINNLYEKYGHVDTTTEYQLEVDPNEPVYHIHFKIEESQKYQIGLLKVRGNKYSENRFIIARSGLLPGEVLTANKLKQAEEFLLSTGCFKSVNIYAEKKNESNSIKHSIALNNSDACLETKHIVIDVEEASTASFNLSGGASTDQSIYVALDFSETNFNYKGFGRMHKYGLSSFRGAGEYLNIRFQFGEKVNTAIVNWMNPYFKDTLWRVGFNAQYSRDTAIKNLVLNTGTLATYAQYPIGQLLAFGVNGRVKYPHVSVKGNQGSDMAQVQENNSSIVTGFSTYLNYDSTPTPYKPHRGIRSSLTAEIAGVLDRKGDKKKSFPFLKLSLLNTFYVPVHQRGTLKIRCDAKFIEPFAKGDALLIPIQEKYLLGGENTVRGYAPGMLGPIIDENTNRNLKDPAPAPLGGISSFLVSTEYLLNIIRPADFFAFFDVGSLTNKRFTIGHLRSSVGVGLLVDIGRQLPIMLGYGYPLNPANRHRDSQNFFFSMGAQF